jgi:hypothetical protein
VCTQEDQGREGALSSSQGGMSQPVIVLQMERRCWLELEGGAGSCALRLAHTGQGEG